MEHAVSQGESHSPKTTSAQREHVEISAMGWSVVSAVVILFMQS